MANTYPWLRLLSTYRDSILRELLLVVEENESIFQGVSGLTDAQQQLQNGLNGFFDHLTPHIRSQLLSSGTPSDLEFGPLMAKMNQVLEEVRGKQAPPGNTEVLEVIASFEAKAAEVLEAVGLAKPDSETDPSQEAIVQALSSLFTVVKSQGDSHTEILAKILELVSGVDEERNRALDQTCNELGGLLHRQLSYTVTGYEQRQGNRRPSRPAQVQYATALIEIFERVGWVFTDQDAQQLQGLVDRLKNLMAGTLEQPSTPQPKKEVGNRTQTEPVHADVNGSDQPSANSAAATTTTPSVADPPESSELTLVSVEDEDSLYSRLSPPMQELLKQAREVEESVATRRSARNSRRNPVTENDE